MPVHLGRAYTTLPPAFMHCVLPPVVPALATLKSAGCAGVRTTSGAAHRIIISPRFPSLLGQKVAHGLVGATVLNTVLRRQLSSLSITSASKEPRFDPLIEPYGAVIRSMQADFLKIGFIKTDEDSNSITFSNGKTKFQLAVTDSHYHPSLVGVFTNNHGAYHRLSSLTAKLNDPETRLKEFEALNDLRKFYGLWKSDTPTALKNEGDRALLRLSLKQTIKFLDTYRQTLSELNPDPVDAQNASITPKVTEKVDREQRIFRRLWISRHDR